MQVSDVDDAMFDFLKAWASPPGTPALVDADGEDQIFKGGQNGNVRPSGTDYLIFTMTSDEPLEHNMDDFETTIDSLEDGTMTIAPLYRFYYQVDSWGVYGRARAARIRAIFNSYKGPEFFQAYKDKYGGIGVVKSRTGNNSTEPDGTNKYAHCWTRDFAVTARLTTVVTQDWLNRLRIDLKGIIPWRSIVG